MLTAPPTSPLLAIAIPGTATGLAALAALALLAAAAVGVVLVRRHRRRRAAARRRGDGDFDLLFPEGPGDQRVRKTMVGRRIGMKPRA